VGYLSALTTVATPTGDQAVTFASVAQGISTAYDELSSSSQTSLLTISQTLTSSLSDTAPAGSIDDLSNTLSSLHRANIASNARTPSAAGSATRSETLRSRIVSLALKSVAGHVDGQDGVLFNTASFTGAIANTNIGTASAGRYKVTSTANFSGATVSIPGFSIPSSSIPSPPATQLASGGTYQAPASSDVMFIFWPYDAQYRFFDSSNDTANIISSSVQIQMFAHSYSSPITVDGQSSTEPIFSVNLSRAVDPKVNATSGQFRKATCVYMTSAQSATVATYSIDGLTTSVDASTGYIQCASTHLTTFSVQDSPAACDGTPYGSAVNDRCGVCQGSNACLDCLGIPFGNATIDACGICGGNNTGGNSTGCLGCDGRLYGLGETAPAVDECGVCGGNSNDKGCDGECFSGLALDVCNACGGDGTACANEVPLFSSSPPRLSGIGGASAVLPSLAISALMAWRASLCGH